MGMYPVHMAASCTSSTGLLSSPTGADNKVKSLLWRLGAHPAYGPDGHMGDLPTALENQELLEGCFTSTGMLFGHQYIRFQGPFPSFSPSVDASSSSSWCPSLQMCLVSAGETNGGLCLAETCRLASKPACESILTMALLHQRTLPSQCCWQSDAGAAGMQVPVPEG